MTAPDPQPTLAAHPRGWLVNGLTGEVFSTSRRWRGRKIGRVGTHGYLVTTNHGNAYLLHRVVWEACVGPILPGMVINHLNGVKTDNRLCNLEVVTPRENNLHARRMGLHRQVNVRGPAHHCYRVTPELHAEILARLAAGLTCLAVANEVGLSEATVSRVKLGRR